MANLEPQSICAVESRRCKKLGGLLVLPIPAVLFHAWGPALGAPGVNTAASGLVRTVSPFVIRPGPPVLALTVGVAVERLLAERTRLAGMAGKAEAAKGFRAR